MIERYIPKDHIFSEIEEWPIAKIYQDREGFVKDIDAFTMERFEGKSNDEINNIIARTIYLERIRMKEEPWKVDRPDEKGFWVWVKKQLVKKSLDQDAKDSIKNNKQLLEQIIHRYSDEVAGGFKVKTFLFARKFLTTFFSRILNSAAGRNFGRFVGKKYRLRERLRVYGEVDKMRALFDKGTVVLVPTHFSNIDSILIGYALDAVAGVPSFSYGAGLNLYNTGYTAYFMNRLGAYRIDRRKKNAVYLETLKGMSNLSIQKGLNSLFFPGGTRSRSGALETRLKRGMLGTAVEAQRGMIEDGKEEKVFIVPLIMSYHFVLEAQSLIEQHLKKTGEEQYISGKDESYSFRKISSFLWQLFSSKSDITLSFGKPMDILGNFVNEAGESLDDKGNTIDIKGYFHDKNGKLSRNIQREGQYTSILADKVVDRFHAENIVLSSHFVAFVAFQILRKQNSKLDLYGVLRLPDEEFSISQKLFNEVGEMVREKMIELEKADKIKLSGLIHGDIETLIKDGIKNSGMYHSSKPLKYNKDGRIISQDFKVLYFYHNRLENYGLHNCIPNNPIDSDQVEEINELHNSLYLRED